MTAIEQRRRRKIDEALRGLTAAFNDPLELRRATFAAFANVLRGFEPVLDIGTGDGLFVEVMAAAGIVCRGIDSDPRRVAVARSYGRDVAEGNLLAIDVADGSLGAMMIANVLEQLDPDDAIGLFVDALRLLRPHGRLAVLVPDAAQAADRFWSDVRRKRPYPRAFVAEALRQVGFEVIGEGPIPPASAAYVIAQRPAQELFTPQDLPYYEDSVFSQNGEDGILRELFSRLGIQPGFFVEFGVQDGRECNAAALAIEADWHGVLIEGDPVLAERAAAVYIDRPGVRVASRFLTRANIAETFAGLDIPREFDLLSIDVDGNDYWLWEALRAYRPRVVVMEMNPHYSPPSRWVMAYNEAHQWHVDDYYGASLGGLHSLARSLGYTLLGTDRRPVNAFFVRDDLLEGTGFPGLSPEQAYRSPAYRFPHREGPSIEAPPPER
jgi:SAM-dependent methyltransferase